MKIRHFLVAPLLLSTAQAHATDMLGSWRLIEQSAGAASEGLITLDFGPTGELRTTTHQDGKPVAVETARYRIEGGELILTFPAGQETRRRLEATGGRARIEVPFGYFVIERVPLAK